MLHLLWRLIKHLPEDGALKRTYMTYSAGLIFVSREQQTRLMAVLIFIGKEHKQLEFKLTHESFT